MRIKTSKAHRVGAKRRRRRMRRMMGPRSQF